MTTSRALIFIAVFAFMFPSRAVAQFSGNDNSSTGIINFFSSERPAGITGFFGIKETPAPTEQLSEAERIIRLVHSIESRQKKLSNIEKEQQSPVNSYSRAEHKFKIVDQQWLERQEEIQNLKNAGQTEKADKLKVESQKLHLEWQEARVEFELAIQERKTSLAQAATLAREIKQLQEDLDQLKGSAPAEAKNAKKKNDGKTAKESTKNGKASGGQAKNREDEPANGKTANAVHAEVSKEVKQAQDLAKAKQQEAKKAKDKALSLGQRLQMLQEQIDQEEKLLAISRKKADLEREIHQKLAQELQQKKLANAAQQEIDDLIQDLGEAEKLAKEAQKKVQESMDTLSQLQGEKNTLLADQIVAMREVTQKQEEARQAQKKVDDLQNPFTWKNITQWLVNHGIKIVIILLVMLTINRVISVTSHRMVKLMAKRSKSRGHDQGGEDRATTLVGVFRSAANITLLVGGILMIVEEVGIPIIPLVGGAAVVGLAVAFGAQNLIRDYFTGFMILMEDQYSINDVVEIGGISGVVERISLRTTVIRDQAGVAHFLPHGTIQTVSNMSHGWSRAVLEIGVAYKEDVDQVMKLLLELARELRRDSVFGQFILEDPEMQGVDKLTDSAVVIKFYLKTKPLKQWMIKRELLRRIKNNFDQLGIEIPFPQRTVYHRYEEPLPATLAAPNRSYSSRKEAS